MKILYFKVIAENEYFKKYSTLQQGTQKIGFHNVIAFSYNVMKIQNHQNNNLFLICRFGLKCFLHP